MACAEKSSRDFFLGPENSLLGLALQATVSGATHYNPIVVYGPTGVGKSHFVQAVAQRYRAEHQKSRVIIVTGADFARGFASATELDSLSDFRTKYRSTQLLILDGLEELANKPAAQIELLHTLDALLKSDRHVLVTARSALGEQRSLHPALKSRLSAGLGVPAVLPSAATRAAVLRAFAAQHGLSLPDSLLETLVHGTGSRPSPLCAVPQLRSAVLELLAECATTQGQIDCQAAVHKLFGRHAERKLTIREVTKHVAGFFHLKASELVGSSRRKGTVQARSVAIYLSRTLTGVSYQKLGQHFGGRDHTTALHAFRCVASAIHSDPATSQAVDSLTQELLGVCRQLPPSSDHARRSRKPAKAGRQQLPKKANRDQRQNVRSRMTSGRTNQR